MDQDTGLAIPSVRPDGLQLDEHRDRQRRYWRMQRIAWWGFGAVMLVAVLGLTGSGGVFHKQTIAFADATVEIPRVSRWEGSDDLSITFHGPGDSHEVIITQPFFDRFAIERIQPEPDQNPLLPGAQAMRFAATDAPPHQVKVDVRAMHFGWTRFDITIGGETRPVSLLVLP